MNALKIKSKLRTVDDFPKKGITFFDIAPILEDPALYDIAINEMLKKFDSFEEVDKIIALDARGFIFASVIARERNKGLVMARKKGKLPYTTISCSYGLEYGNNELEIHIDSIKPNEKAVIIDDLLATGGTAEAAGNICKQLGGIVQGFLFFSEIEALNGRRKLNGHKVESFIKL